MPRTPSDELRHQRSQSPSDMHSTECLDTLILDDGFRVTVPLSLCGFWYTHPEWRDALGLSADTPVCPQGRKRAIMDQCGVFDRTWWYGDDGTRIVPYFRWIARECDRERSPREMKNQGEKMWAMERPDVPENSCCASLDCTPTLSAPLAPINYTPISTTSLPLPIVSPGNNRTEMSLDFTEEDELPLPCKGCSIERMHLAFSNDSRSGLVDEHFKRVVRSCLLNGVDQIISQPPVSTECGAIYFPVSAESTFVLESSGSLSSVPWVFRSTCCSGVGTPTRYKSYQGHEMCEHCLPVSSTIA